MDNVPTGGCQTFPSTPGEKDKFPPNRPEVGQIWTTDTWSDRHDFSQKSFLGSQYAISSEIQWKFRDAQLRAKNLHTRRSTKFVDSLKEP